MDESGPKFSGEQAFLTPLLASACRFLEDQRENGQAWGEFKEGAGGLYYAYLAVSALCAMYPSGSENADSLNHRIAIVELRANDRFPAEHDSLDLNGLVNLLEIVRTQKTPDLAQIVKIGKYIEKKLAKELENPNNLRVRELARSLTGLVRAGISESLVFKSGLRQLLKMEKEGQGWPGGMTGDASVIVTAIVVEALRTVDPVGSADAIRRGERFLESAVVESGWIRIGMGDDTFAQATVLRVLAHSASPETIEAGIAAIKAAANDNGWGPGPQQPSSVETTAIVLLALAATGENRYVPYRTAAARLAAATSSKSAIENELKDLQDNFNHRLAKESSVILADRDKLRSESKEKSATIDKLKEQLVELEQDLLAQSRESRVLHHELSRGRTVSLLGTRMMSEGRLQVFTNIATIALLGLAGISFFVMYKWFPEKITRWISPNFAIYYSIGLSIASLGVQLFLQIRQMLNLSSAVVFDDYKRRDPAFEAALLRRFEGESRGPVSSVVSRYSDIIAELPMVVREELNYSLTRRLVDMPKDVGMEYAQDIVLKLGITKDSVDRILNWVSLFLGLDSFTRRAVTEQIRRQTEPT